MPEPQELEHIIQRDVASRDIPELAAGVAKISDCLEPEERVLGAAAGKWLRDKRVVVVATSRRVLAADDDRVELLRYSQMLEVEYEEGWRKGRILIRAQGAVADIHDVHVNTARALKKVIDTARRSTSTPGTTIPPGV